MHLPFRDFEFWAEKAFQFHKTLPKGPKAAICFPISTKSKKVKKDVTKTGNGEWGMGNGMIPGNGKLKWEFEKKN